jgi:hypothetical protein
MVVDDAGECIKDDFKKLFFITEQEFMAGLNRQ